MSEILAIFEKINQLYGLMNNDGEKYKMYFSPYSTGYTSEDFTFLKTSSGSTGEGALDFYDEAYDFSVIANNIPRSENGIWSPSGENNNLLYNNYKDIINLLTVLDPTPEDMEYLYKAPIFQKALDISGTSIERETYRIYLNLYIETHNQIEFLENEAISPTIEIKLELERTRLTEIELKWNNNGFKNKIEVNIIQVFENEAMRFISAREDAITKMSNSERTGNNLEYFFTTCFPNNLYEADKLSWNNIVLQKEQLEQLIQNANVNYVELVKGTALENIELEEISFELLFVKIIRPWFDEDILLSPFWDLKILNKESVSIPRYATELVFVRNVYLKLTQNSEKNQEIIEENEKKSDSRKGLFALNVSANKRTIELFQQKKSLNLQKINKRERLSDHPTITRSSMRLLKKNMKSFLLTFKSNSGALINPTNAMLYVDGKAYKAYKLVNDNSLKVTLPAAKTYSVELNDESYVNELIPFDYNSDENKLNTIKREFVVKSKSKSPDFRRHFGRAGNYVKLEITWKTEDTNEIVDPTSTEFFVDGQLQNVYKKVNGKVLTVTLVKTKNYTVEFISDGNYIEETHSLILSQKEKEQNETIKRTFTLKPSPEIISDSRLTNGEFQLLGVVCKQLPTIPNPIIKI